MNNNEKDLSKSLNLLKWQIDMGADAMIEENNNYLFLKNETISKRNDLRENYSTKIDKNIRLDYKKNKNNIIIFDKKKKK